MFNIKGLAQALRSYEPLDLSSTLSQFAAVAVILRMSENGRPQIGYIRRADQLNDRWAGHVAFPGGKHDPEDETSLDTAIRETFEEIGVRLERTSHLGRLADVQARNQLRMLSFFIRPHVFAIEGEPELALDAAEVASFAWVDLDWILEPAHRQTYVIDSPAGRRELPAILMPDQSVLWGLTYMMTEEFLGLLTRHRLT